MLNKIVCPFCFKKFWAKNIKFRCFNTVGCDKGKKREIFNGKIRDSKCICPECNRTTNMKVCPECGHDLPKDILENETKIISIIGGKGTGKSYFVGTLLRMIMERSCLANYNGMSVRFVGDSDEEYNKRFRGFLDNQRLLSGTLRHLDIIKDNPPILIQTTQTIKRILSTKLVTDTFSFFDAAGETFEDREEVQLITPYLENSTAIIMILDPRQVPFLDSKISEAFPGLDRPTDRTYSSILNNTIDLLQKQLNVKRIDIPLCIAFSKWDLLVNTPDLLPEGMSISTMNQRMGSFDEDIVNTMSEEMKSLLLRWDKDLVNTAENFFSLVKYFAFSAWGTSETNGKAAPPISSYRVEDSFLYILYLLGMI